jgi:pimeloyl-ACP methyl ester carboxylesterase
MIKNLIAGLLLLGFTGARVAGQGIQQITCKADPSQTYALYVPARGDRQPLPVVYFFDSHGVGSLPLRKYKTLADAYGFILVGSNNSRNGNDWATTERIWNRLYDDTRSRLRIDGNRIYTCGFSGGAKVAGYVAIQHPGIKGVIANGAGLPDGVSAGDLPFSFTAITGEGDMNMTELVAVTRDLDKTRTRHRILFFDGIHEWAPEATMRTAFGGLDLDAMAMGLIPKDASKIDAYIRRGKQRVNVLIRTNKLVGARQECDVAISYLNGVSGETTWFERQAAALDHNATYIKQRDARQRLLGVEENTKAEYMQHFQQADMHYWTTTIQGLMANARAKTAEGAMYQRLLAYLSLAFYSISNQLINAGQNAGARHFVELYKMADPGNSEAWYFSAILDAREGNGHAATDELIKAVGCGFNDKARLRRQPEFQRLSAQIDLAGIERRMHS